MSMGFDTTWMWHPAFSEEQPDTAGVFVHFRRSLEITDRPPKHLSIDITADTRYKLYVNRRLVTFGPVKGDQHLWFYDNIDIAPYLRQGINQIGVHVLRFFHSTSYAPSFPRLPSGGLRVSVPGEQPWAKQLVSSTLWETAIDPFTVLRVDEPEDHFLHIYERTSFLEDFRLDWVAAKLLEFKNSTGNSPPWQLSPRQIPPLRTQQVSVAEVRNVNSTIDANTWYANLGNKIPNSLCLPAGSRHRLDLIMPHHVTAFLRLRFRRPVTGGGYLTMTYSESFEDKPEEVPWVRNKGDRCDFGKAIHGPRDIYEFQGMTLATGLGYFENDADFEVFMPFHFRTFRFCRLDIHVGSCDLAIDGLEIEAVNYPLDVHASFVADTTSSDQGSFWDKLWKTSVLTLSNCMHDCYEDCPMYEQLQYAMDTRSSSLFTYLLSGDDRLAKQAIIQLHNSFQARLGLTASRAPSHRQQFIPHFSLYWICLVADHWAYFGNTEFTSQFLPVIDSVLTYFESRIDDHGLVTSEVKPGIWHFVDWTREWKPHGIPPAIAKTGISTYANQLYAYTLENSAQLVDALGRNTIALEYRSRRDNIIAALRTNCYDGEFFSDTLSSATTSTDYSQHCQIWGVLCGAVVDDEAQRLLRSSLARTSAGQFVRESVSMSFYTMRALSMVGGSLYDESFNQFWGPWREQLQQNVTTWVEDSVSQRSDCHAWGCVPIYEFMVEVVGIRPRDPGWNAIDFQPRVGLFRDLKATIPIPNAGGSIRGLIHVSWSTNIAGDKEVQVKTELPGPNTMAVVVSLPDVKTTYEASKKLCFIVQKASLARYN
ncbi:hypothetical protein NW762_004551 [Fusarium torreyae]|uniref:Alpha-L-rhamnosidase six-hairpin glycosidase domain-containing protein n=1 Tax=Fusarium torreyae TaxID=1237075 RepID=A0A9W8VH17_9HYPO|nr:hypothetical protein NW762_004551 [Fusarium torreyae]